MRALFCHIYRAVIAAELALQKLFDRFLAQPEQNAELLSQLTITIKTFERPLALRRLVESIQQFYPRVRIVVVDDSAEQLQLDGVTTITMPFDSGVSAGRQRALEAVETRYVMVLDDDYIFTRRSGLVPCLRYLQRNEAVDIVGGERIDLR